ncbi:MAG: ankyrin repeat domain-containing protein [Acidobacteriia bacterium]|nr:ankyrin repeat domain-containing protein [Terriglobia bacterium]
MQTKAVANLAAFLFAAGVISGADGTPPLVWAAHTNDVKTAESLIRAGADVKQASPFGATPLSEAAQNGNAALIEMLLSAGANANAVTGEGEAALHAASKSGNAEAVHVLLAHGAKVDARETWRGQTALMWAAAANRAAVVRLLLESGADPNARSTMWPPEAIKRPKNGNVVSDRPKGGLTPLLYAAREGALQSAQALLKAGADPNLAEPDGITPLITALMNAHYDVAALLLDAGADSNLADRYGRAPLYTAIDMHTLEASVTRPAPHENDRLTALDVAGMLLARGANANARLAEPLPGRGLSDDPDAVLRDGTTPFLRAARTGDLAAMRLLLEHGADPAITTANGTTALLIAAGLGWRYGLTQLPESTAIETVQLCLDLKADINQANERGETALHAAAERGGERLIEFLAAHGARLDAKDKNGRTPLDVAAGNSGLGNPAYPSTMALLRSLAK